MDPSNYKFRRYKHLFCMFVQGSHVKIHAEQEWNVFCRESILVDVPLLWHRLAHKLVILAPAAQATQACLLPRPRFKSSFNVGLWMTTRALELSGVDPAVIRRTRDSLYTQQEGIEAAQRATRHYLRTARTFPHAS